MAIIPDKSNGEVLEASELFKLLGEDQTEGSITSSTDETNIGQVQLTAGDAHTGVLIIASGKFKSLNASDTTGTIKLYTGENAAFGSNTLRKTITRTADSTTAAGSDFSEPGWTICMFITAETWANSIYIQITGQNPSSSNACETYCESLVVIGV